MTKRTALRRRLACAGAFAVMLIASACGSAAGAGQAAKSQAGGPGPKGSPIKIVFLNQGNTPGIQVDPEDYPAMAAETDYINATGGINGHKLILSQCSSDGNENLARTCADNVVSGKENVAVVNEFTIFPTVTLPILQAGGVPTIGDYAVSANQLQSPDSFPISSGAVIGPACEADVLAQQLHVKKIGISVNSGNQAASIAAATSQILGATYGFGLSGNTPIPSNAPDLQPTVVALTSGVKGALVVTGITDTVRILETSASLGMTTPISYTARSLPPSELSAINTRTRASYVASDVAVYSDNSAVPGVRQFKKVMDAYAPGDDRDDSSLEAYLSVALFAGAAKTIHGPVTRTSVLAAMRGLRNWNSGGIIPPYSSVTPPGPFAKAFPRAFDPYCTAAEVKNGRLVPLNGGTFFDPLAKGAPAVRP